MITPKIKSLISADLNNGELPDDPMNCHIGMQAEIGSANSEGADIFSFEVVTPTKLVGTGRTWGRGLLIMDEFSWTAVAAALERLLAQCAGADWNEVTVKLNKELHWEFDNYQAYNGAV